MSEMESYKSMGDGELLAAFSASLHGNRDIQKIQSIFVDLIGTSLPPCFYCDPEKLRKCSEEGEDCTRYREYHGV
jgi:hypothetical protein